MNKYNPSFYLDETLRIIQSGENTIDKIQDFWKKMEPSILEQLPRIIVLKLLAEKLVFSSDIMYLSFDGLLLLEQGGFSGQIEKDKTDRERIERLDSRNLLLTWGAVGISSAVFLLEIVKTFVLGFCD